MNKSLLFIYLVSFLLVCLSWSCDNTVKLNAPPKDIWIVYGVLNQADSAQYIRVSKAFLVEGDALEYAQQNDESVKGLNITLEGNGQTLTATQTDSVLKDPASGTFYPYVTIYKFDTQGSTELEPGERYKLTITQPDVDSIFITSYSWVPHIPKLVTPRLLPCSGQASSLQPLDLDKDFKLEFSREDGEGGPVGFEIRAFFNYTADAVPALATYGPTPLFFEDYRCVNGVSRMCYQFSANELLTSFKGKLNDPDVFYEYEKDPLCEAPENLPKSFWFEVTAVDTFLANYLLANDPKFQEFSGNTLEYTNIVSDLDVYGVFGSISIDRQYAKFAACTEYKLELNNTPQPNESCQR